LCEEEEISSFVLDQGQSKKIVNYNYPNNDNGCISGRTVVSSLPVQASGGCFHKNFYPSGSFLYEKSVINARGEFVACKQIPGGLQSYSFITTQPSPCGSPIVGVRPGQNAVCLPSGDWHLISDSNITVIDETAWTPSVQSSYRQGCCPEDKCWNGTGCQPADTYYSIDGRGFICK